eukprot:177214_1
MTNYDNNSFIFIPTHHLFICTLLFLYLDFFITSMTIDICYSSTRGIIIIYLILVTSGIRALIQNPRRLFADFEKPPIGDLGTPTSSTIASFGINSMDMSDASEISKPHSDEPNEIVYLGPILFRLIDKPKEVMKQLPIIHGSKIELENDSSKYYMIRIYFTNTPAKHLIKNGYKNPNVFIYVLDYIKINKRDSVIIDVYKEIKDRFNRDGVHNVTHALKIIATKHIKLILCKKHVRLFRRLNIPSYYEYAVAEFDLQKFL